MTIYGYKKEKTSSEEYILRPLIDIILQSKVATIEVSMYLDSGADISLIRYRLGKVLGFRKESIDRLESLGGIGGRIYYIRKSITFIIGGRKLLGEIAWSQTETIPLLIGRKHIFNQFQITFDEAKERIIFS